MQKLQVWLEDKLKGKKMNSQSLMAKLDKANKIRDQVRGKAVDDDDEYSAY